MRKMQGYIMSLKIKWQIKSLLWAIQFHFFKLRVRRDFRKLEKKLFGGKNGKGMVGK